MALLFECSRQAPGRVPAVLNKTAAHRPDGLTSGRAGGAGHGHGRGHLVLPPRFPDRCFDGRFGIAEAQAGRDQVERPAVSKNDPVRACLPRPIRSSPGVARSTRKRFQWPGTKLCRVRALSRAVRKTGGHGPRHATCGWSVKATSESGPIQALEQTIAALGAPVLLRTVGNSVSPVAAIARWRHGGTAIDIAPSDTVRLALSLVDGKHARNPAWEGPLADRVRGGSVSVFSPQDRIRVAVEGQAAYCGSSCQSASSKPRSGSGSWACRCSTCTTIDSRRT